MKFHGWLVREVSFIVNELFISWSLFFACKFASLYFFPFALYGLLLAIFLRGLFTDGRGTFDTPVS